MEETRKLTVIISGEETELQLPYSATIADMRENVIVKTGSQSVKVWEPVRDNSGQVWNDTDIPSEEFCPYYLSRPVGVGA